MLQLHPMIIRVFGFIPLVLVSMFCSSCASQVEIAENHFARSKRFEQHGHQEESLRELELVRIAIKKALEESSKEAERSERHLARSKRLKQEGRQEEALRELELARLAASHALEKNLKIAQKVP